MSQAKFQKITKAYRNFKNNANTYWHASNSSSYGTLSEGTYRIVKTIYMGEQNKSIASAFVI